jgi:primase-polymerase (primpol)-like protein
MANIANAASKEKRPKALPVKPDGIPAELKKIPQWMTWKYTWIADREEWTKPPYNPRTGMKASSTDPTRS